MTQPQATLGVIGGSGFYALDGLHDARSVTIETPYGPPSSDVLMGRLGETDVAFITRHGPGHRLTPTEVPNRANVWALASLGVRQLLSVSAVGSLKREIEPLHFVVPDQLIDRLNAARPATFFGDGIVGHVAFDMPYCETLGAALHNATTSTSATVHKGGSLVVIEGPAFSTKAESVLYQSWGASIIGMTSLPEARLAREAGMCYACLACVTDYDTWHEEHGSVTVELVIRNLLRNVETAKRVVTNLAGALPDSANCDCCGSLSSAIITDLSIVPEETKRRLAPILARYDLA